MKRRLVWSALAVLAVAVVGLTGSTMLHLEIPAPTGKHAVGRTSIIWTDTGREERHTSESGDHRSVPVTVWYPAQIDSGAPGDYLEDLEKISPGLVASGELGSIEVWGLRFVRDSVRIDAAVATDQPSYPTVVLSPGNGERRFLCLDG